MKATKEHMKKLISIVVMFGLITSHVACSPKLQHISSPIDQVKLPKDYTYTVKLKSQEKVRGLQTEDIIQSEGKVSLKTPNETKSIMSYDVEYIYGIANVGTERNMPRDIGIGMGLGLAFGSAVGLFATAGSKLKYVCFIGEECPVEPKQSFWEEYDTWIIPMASGLVIGGLVGAAVASKPKKKQILIIPTVAPTAQGGVDAGVNVGLKF